MFSCSLLNLILCFRVAFGAVLACSLQSSWASGGLVWWLLVGVPKTFSLVWAVLRFTPKMLARWPFKG